MQKPTINEYNPYFQRYIDLTTDDDFMDQLNENTADAVQYFSQVPADKHDYSYEKDKWTIKQVLQHIIDTERVFAYRALVASRGDSETPLHKMDPDKYVASVDVSERSLESLVWEFTTVRSATMVLYEYMTEEHSERIGNNVGFPITARALGYIMMGHIWHHINIIDERYMD